MQTEKQTAREREREIDIYIYIHTWIHINKQIHTYMCIYIYICILYCCECREIEISDFGSLGTLSLNRGPGLRPRVPTPPTMQEV